MAPSRMISHRQMELLIEFAEQNCSVALNKHRNGPHGHQDSLKAWDELAKTLNCLGEGTTKTGDKWRRYWHLLKCRTKAKAADNRRNRVGTGGGPNKICPLTDIEQRIVCLIGKVAIEGNPNVQIPMNLSDQNQMPLQPAVQSDAQLAPAVSCTSTQVLEEPFEYVVPYEVNVSGSISNTHIQDHTYVTGEETLQVPDFPEQSETRSPGAHQLSNSTPRVRNPMRGRRQSRTNHDDNVPRWAYEIEERRIAAEERLADAVVGLSAHVQQLAATHQQILELLHNLNRHFNPPQ